MKTFILEVVLPASAAVGLLVGLAVPSARAGQPAAVEAPVAVLAIGESGIERSCERGPGSAGFRATRCQ